MSRILEAYDESIFEFSPNFLIVTLPFEKSFSLPIGNDSGNEIISAIADNPAITLDTLSVQLGMAKRTLSREMKRMKENGMIRRIGSPRAGRWEITKECSSDCERHR